MKLVYDLKDPVDRRDLGGKLALALKADSALWQGLDDVRRHLEQQLADEVFATSRDTLVSRMVARLLGDRAQKHHALQAEDYARIQGQREALGVFLMTLRKLANEAEFAATTEAEAAANQKPRYPVRVPGRSAM